MRALLGLQGSMRQAKQAAAEAAEATLGVQLALAQEEVGNLCVEAAMAKAEKEQALIDAECRVKDAAAAFAAPEAAAAKGGRLKQEDVETQKSLHGFGMHRLLRASIVDMSKKGNTSRPSMSHGF